MRFSLRNFTNIEELKRNLSKKNPEIFSIEIEDNNDHKDLLKLKLNFGQFLHRDRGRF